MSILYYSGDNLLIRSMCIGDAKPICHMVGIRPWKPMKITTGIRKKTNERY